MRDFVTVVSGLMMIVGAISILVPLRFLRIRSRKQGLGLAIFGLVAGIVSVSDAPKTGTPESAQSVAAAQSAQAPAPSPKPIPAPPSDAAPKRKSLLATIVDSGTQSGVQPALSVEPDKPGDQRRFLAILQQARSQFATAQNDMARGAARPSRANSICRAFGNLRVENWVGKVSALSSNGDGKGVLVISVDKDASVATWNNSFSDASYRTLIEPSSRLFQNASALSVGQWVRFSGTFFKNDVDCFAEQSATLSGSLRDPEFVFRFSDIAPLN